MTKITRDKVEKVLAQIAKEQPDTVAACYYSEEYRDVAIKSNEERIPQNRWPEVEANTPCCIVGQVVYRLKGVEGLNTLSEGIPVERSMPNENGSDVADQLAELGFTSGSIEMLSRVQEIQDSGRPWGRAVPVVISHKNDDWYEVDYEYEIPLTSKSK